jgi:hypothetical protein
VYRYLSNLAGAWLVVWATLRFLKKARLARTDAVAQKMRRALKKAEQAPPTPFFGAFGACAFVPQVRRPSCLPEQPRCHSTVSTALPYLPDSLILLPL